VAVAEVYEQRAIALQRRLAVVTLNPRSWDAAAAVALWCGVGQAVALVGSSGVGKSTLVNTLAGPMQELAQQTGESANMMPKDVTPQPRVRFTPLQGRMSD
jgi:ribosome biogenesis GTPase